MGDRLFLSIGRKIGNRPAAGGPRSPQRGSGRLGHATLAIANGAKGGQAASAWDSPNDPNYNRIRDQVLAPKGLTEAQVQAVWVKVANRGPTQSLPSPNADAFTMVEQMGDIARALRVRYPNVKLVFLST